MSSVFLCHPISQQWSNKKHSENADTSTSVTFDLEFMLNLLECAMTNYRDINLYQMYIGLDSENNFEFHPTLKCVQSLQLFPWQLHVIFIEVLKKSSCYLLIYNHSSNRKRNSSVGRACIWETKGRLYYPPQCKITTVNFFFKSEALFVFFIAIFSKYLFTIWSYLVSKWRQWKVLSNDKLHFLKYV